MMAQRHPFRGVGTQHRPEVAPIGADYSAPSDTVRQFFEWSNRIGHGIDRDCAGPDRELRDLQVRQQRCPTSIPSAVPNKPTDYAPQLEIPINSTTPSQLPSDKFL